MFSLGRLPDSGVHGNNLRYAALTGTLAIRWEGARLPIVWTVPPPEMELARRYLHIFGPTTSKGFAKWASIGTRKAAAVFDELGTSLIPVQTPAGDAWILGRDERTMREPPGPVAAARLLPSGVVGTWRRARGRVTIQTWQRLSRAAREAVVTEAESLPLPDTAGRIVVHCD